MVGGRNGTGETQKNTTEMNKTAYYTKKLRRNGFGTHLFYDGVGLLPTF